MRSWPRSYPRAGPASHALRDGVRRRKRSVRRVLTTPGEGEIAARHGCSPGSRHRRHRPDPRGRRRRPPHLYNRRRTGLPPSSPRPRLLLRGLHGGHRGAAGPRLDREPGDPARVDGRVDLQPLAAATSRPPAATRGAASSTATTRAGEPSGTRTSSVSSSSSPAPCPTCGRRSRSTFVVGTMRPGPRGRPSSCASWTRPWCGSATPSTPRTTGPTA